MNIEYIWIYWICYFRNEKEKFHSKMKLKNIFRKEYEYDDSKYRYEKLQWLKNDEKLQMRSYRILMTCMILKTLVY